MKQKTQKLSATKAEKQPAADCNNPSGGTHINYVKAGGKQQEPDIPQRHSFEEFLLSDARVPSGRGAYGPYTFAGREPLLAIVRTIDLILGAPSTGSASSLLNPSHSLLPDAELTLAGGAQFGKTILELTLAAYLTAQQFRNFGLYLPDDDLVEGIVDSKFRPDVVDQIGWFAEMVQVGKALNKSGRAVNRKGAFLVTDGQRKAVGMVRGLGKVPTTFSMDAAAMDELDDIQPRMMKFVRGRLTASDLRFILKIGTQRIHGRGMNKAWKDGSQGVFMFKCPACGKMHNPEEEFPQIIRLKSSSSSPSSSNPSHSSPSVPPCLRGENPKLTWSGDFKSDGNDTASFAHEPQNQYYLGCVSCGAELDRTQPIEEHRQPAFVKQRKWSYRISQLSIAAIDLSQIVARFQSAVADAEEMIVFRCDVLGLPQSTSQSLTPAILDRARSIEIFDLPPRVHEGNLAFAGLDMGDRCWLFARESSVAAVCDRHQSANGAPSSVSARSASEGNSGSSSTDISENLYQPNATALAKRGNEFSLSPGERAGVRVSVTQTQIASPESQQPLPGSPSAINPQLSTPHNRLLSAHKIPAADVVAQAQILFHRLGLSALFIDERPLVNEARAIALALNGLSSLANWPRIGNINEAHVKLPGGLTWDGKNARWLNLKCAVVRFTKSKLGSGIEQTIVFFEEGGQTKFVPCIACNRFETIDRVVREFLTPAEGIIELSSSSSSSSSPSKLRETPAMLLPRMTPGHPPILDTVDSHLITGSERERDSDGSLGDYVDGCENHLLLANAYSALAATICNAPAPEIKYSHPFVLFENTKQSRVIRERMNPYLLG